MKMAKLSFLFMVIIICFMITGCSRDSNEIDDQIYALVIGADKGVDNKLRFTVQYPTYKSESESGEMEKSGEGEDGEESMEISGTIVTTVEASNLLEAVDLLNTAATRRISLVHIKMIVFSEKLSREGIESILEPIARFREARRIMQVVVCRGNVEDFIKENKTLVGGSVSKAMELTLRQYKNTGSFPVNPFHNFYKEILSPYEQSYAIYAGVNDFKNLKPLDGKESPFEAEKDFLPGDEPRRGDLKNEYIGTAVFDGDRMVGSLNAIETRYLLMIKGQFVKGILSLEDKEREGYAIPLDIRLGRRPKSKVRFEKGIPVIEIKLNIEADIGAIESRIAYVKLSKIDELNKQIEEHIQDGVQKTIEKTQKEFGSDIFAFGRFAARHFNTIQEFEDYNWLAHYEDAKVNVDVEANIRRTGLMFSSSPIRYSKKKIRSKESK